jgi:glycine oxidase
MNRFPDVVVLGGGVIGLSVAYFAAREGLRVAVVDKGDLGQEASWAGAGILPPGRPTAQLQPFDQLRALSASLYPDLSAELRQRTGIDNGYLRSGGMELDLADEAAVLEQWRAEGISFEIVEGEDLREREPALAPDIRRAFFLPEMAQLRNPRHLKALIAGCSALGVTLVPGCPVFALEREGARVIAALSAGGPLRASQYVLTAGAWTDSLLEPLGHRPGIRPVRGQIALLHASPLLRRVILDGKRYLVPRPDGRVLIGATEEDVGFLKQTTAGGVGGLLSFAIRLAPGLVDAQVERCWAGLRPGTPDGLPFIGFVPGAANLIVAAGHFRSGIQMSPATAHVVTELLLGQRTTIPLKAFRLDRVPAPPSSLAFRS